MMCERQAACLVPFGALLPALAVGCVEEHSKAKIVDVVATVQSIDVPGRTFVVSAFVAKHEREELFTVAVTEETEFLIDGSLSALEDLKVGESVVGSAKIVEAGRTSQIIALTIRVERSEQTHPPEG